MNILKIKTAWYNWELWIFKLAVFCSGILTGVYLSHYLVNYLSFFIVPAIVGLVFSAYCWIEKLRS